MKFKEVAHLYLGCKGQSTYNGKDESTGKIIPVELQTLRRLESVGIHSDSVVLMWVGGMLSGNSHKPILRRLDSINEQEDRHACITTQLKGGVIGCAECVVYLTSKYIDCFGLIESGEAIDASTLNPNPYAK